MDSLENFWDQLSQVDNDIDLICQLVDWLRPEEVDQVQEVVDKIQRLTLAMENDPEQAALLREKIQSFVVRLRFLPLYSDTGILPRRAFTAELWRRVYNKYMPQATVVFSANTLLAQVFDKPSDPAWVRAVPDEAWMQLFHTFLPGGSSQKVTDHLLGEALYALEMLSIRLAAEEMEDDLLRLDPSILDHDSNFIAQARELSYFVAAHRKRLHPIATKPATRPDLGDADVFEHHGRRPRLGYVAAVQ